MSTRGIILTVLEAGALSAAIILAGRHTLAALVLMAGALVLIALDGRRQWSVRK